MAPMYPVKAPDEGNDTGDSASVGFCAFFASLEPAPKGTLRVFDRGDYYTCYGHDALLVARDVYRTNTVLRWIGPRSFRFQPTSPQPGLPSCSLSTPAATSFLRSCLTSRQLRVELYATPTSNGKLGSKWEVKATASPGNLEPLAELLFSSSDILINPVIACLTIKNGKSNKTIGVSWVDAEAKSIGVSEFFESDGGGSLGSLESFMIQLGVKECLIPLGSGSGGEVSEVEKEWNLVRECLEGIGIVVTERKRSEWSSKSIEQDVSRLLKSNISFITTPQFDMKVALPALNPLITFLELLSNPLAHGSFSLVSHSLSEHLRLDPAAVKALHLFPASSSIGQINSSNLGSNKSMSVFGVLNKCKTSQGTRLLARWISQPLLTLHSLMARQLLVSFASSPNLTEVSSIVRDDQLRAIPDLVRLSKRFSRGKAGLEEVVRCYQAVERIPLIIEALETGLQLFDDDESEEVIESKKWVEEMWLESFREAKTLLEPFSEMVETTLDLTQLSQHRFQIQPSFDSTLQELSKSLERNRDELDEEHLRVARELNVNVGSKSILHFEMHQVYGQVFRVTRKESSVLRGKKWVIELSNRNNGTHFTTRELKELNNEVKDLTLKYEKKQSALVKEVIAIAASYCPILEKLNDVIAHLDVIFSFAHVSINAPTPYTRPKLHPIGEGDVILKECRHPCLELQDDINFIPNDVTMKRGQSEFCIITGPNMGGKSTYIRQVGVVALMAQIGSNVPCSEASLPIFDSILARVGAGDSQIKGVSTFMAEMLETATILKTATKNSLVIIDELGRGTSTQDGFGLAWAISEHIATEIRSFCLFASHFHELTALSQQVLHVQNLHVVAHIDSKGGGGDITLLYKVEEGICDQSFGIHVAELANFPEEVVKLARRKADELEDFGNDDEFEQNSLLGLVSKQDTIKGTNLVEEMLKVWCDDTGDVEMLEDDEQSLERQCQILQSCFEKFKPQFLENNWCQKILAQTY